MLDFVYVGIIFSLAAFMFYLSHNISIVRLFVVSEDKLRRLTNLMYLSTTFALFELYIGVFAILYYIGYLDKDSVLMFLNPAAIWVIYTSSIFLSRYEKQAEKYGTAIKLIGLILLGLTALIIIDYEQILIFLAYLILTIPLTLTVFKSFFKRISSEILKLREIDPVEKARGLGALITNIGVILALFFFIVNRFSNNLFGFLATASQISMAAAFYGIYINLVPPDFLIKLFSRGDG